MKSATLGSVLAVTAAILWGVSGTFAQFLFQRRGIGAEWLVTIRLLSAGALLLVVAKTIRGQNLLPVWRERRDAVAIVVFGIFGMLAVQYTYFAAIRESNAATATVLQYLGPVMIAAYYAWINRRIPHIVEILALVLAVSGTFLLVTHGSLHALTITPLALFLGLLSAAALASYSIQPVPLLKKYDAAVVVGWGMLIGGLAMSFVHPPWRTAGVWDATTYLSTAFILIFGSLIPFYAYLTAVKIVGASTASLLACAEPLSAALVGVLWLGTSFGGADWLGTLLIVGTVAILTWRERR